MSNAIAQPVYMDYAAATPVDQQVIGAMQPYWTDKFYNPSNIYTAAREVRSQLEEARSHIAHWLGARPSEVVFTAGATEANNLAIIGIMEQFKNANCIVSSIEHDSVLGPAQKFECRKVAVNEAGRVDLHALQNLIDDNTLFVSIGYVNNEIGAIQPLGEIAHIIKSIRAQRKKDGNTMPILFHTDAAQAAQYLDLHVDRIGVDLLSMNGGKIYGPKQSGVLFIRGGTTLQPQISGGGQEFGYRSGTENVAACIGLATALDISQKTRNEEAKRIEVLRDIFIDTLSEAFPDAKINGSKNHRIANNISVSFEGLDGERLVMMLDEHGVICNTGAACSAQKDESSHVIKALGKDESQARGTLRFTLGRQTTESDCIRAIEVLKKVIKEYQGLNDAN